MAWMLRVPVVKVVGHEMVGPFDTWGKAKSESMNSSLKANPREQEIEIVEVP